MATRTIGTQSAHDAAVHAAGQIYQQHGRSSWLNPDGEKNKSWSGRYIDVIAPSSRAEPAAPLTTASKRTGSASTSPAGTRRGSGSRMQAERRLGSWWRED